MLCETTERIVRVSEEELAAALDEAPSELTVGVGDQATVLKSRTPSDPYPTPMGASLGITVTESLWPELAEGIARQKAVDMLEGGSLTTVNGYEVRPGTPFETLVGVVQGRMHRQGPRGRGSPEHGRHRLHLGRHRVRSVRLRHSRQLPAHRPVADPVPVRAKGQLPGATQGRSHAEPWRHDLCRFARHDRRHARPARGRGPLLHRLRTRCSTPSSTRTSAAARSTISATSRT